MTSQAPFLRALAAHIATHDLPLVNIYSDHAGGWVLCPTGLANEAAALAEWARSMNVVTLTVRTLPTQVHVEFCSLIGGRAVQMWCSVAVVTVGLGGHPVRAWGRLHALRGLTKVSVTDLAHIAEHGVLPDRRVDR